MYHYISEELTVDWDTNINLIKSPADGSVGFIM